jgi:CheY-like chemotaxis protein
MNALLEAEPQSATVAVIEDDPEVRLDLAEQLEAIAPNTRLLMADTTERANHIIETEDIDVFSVDFDMNGYTVGPDLLTKISRLQVTARKVVYTQFAQLQRQAMQHGADEFVIKRKAQYANTVQRHLRHAHAHRIAAALKEHAGVTFDETLDTTDYERAVFHEARQSAQQAFLEDVSVVDLIEAMKRRGWWRTLDLHEFSRLEQPKKLQTLCSYIPVEPRTIAASIGIEEAGAEGLLSTDNAWAWLPDGATFQRADAFLSLLAYLLRLADYQPELIEHYWSAIGLFEGSVSPPPWDREGLPVFLNRAGTAGLSDAITWIRSH